MDEWKDRLKAEYAQLKERYEKLKAWNNKRTVASELAYYHTPCTSEADAAERRKQQYHDELTNQQQRIMGEYLHILELRAEVAGIML